MYVFESMHPTTLSISHPKIRLRTGFTLTEILVTIGILAILAAILVPIVSSGRERAQIAKCTSNLRNMYMAIELYANDHNGRYPGPVWNSIRYTVTGRPPQAEYHPLEWYLAPYMEAEVPSTSVQDTLFVPALFNETYHSSAPDEAFHYQRHPFASRSPFGGRDGADPEQESAPTTRYNISERFDGKSPSQIAAIATRNLPDGSALYSGKRNFLFMDGHVKLGEGTGWYSGP